MMATCRFDTPPRQTYEREKELTEFTVTVTVAGAAAATTAGLLAAAGLPAAIGFAAGPVAFMPPLAAGAGGAGWPTIFSQQRCSIKT